MGLPLLAQRSYALPARARHATRDNLHAGAVAFVGGHDDEPAEADPELLPEVVAISALLQRDERVLAGLLSPVSLRFRPKDFENLVEKSAGVHVDYSFGEPSNEANRNFSAHTSPTRNLEERSMTYPACSGQIM